MEEASLIAKFLGKPIIIYTHMSALEACRESTSNANAHMAFAKDCMETFGRVEREPVKHRTEKKTFKRHLESEITKSGVKPNALLHASVWVLGYLPE